LPHTIVEENVWIENAVVGSKSVIKKGVIMVSKTPKVNLRVVGNHEIVDPSTEENQINNIVTSVL
jgi:glucose-1-phosphate adenylyltransferase